MWSNHRVVIARVFSENWGFAGMFRHCVAPRRQLSTQFDRFRVAVLMQSATAERLKH